jgi:hypothetical protein
MYMDRSPDEDKPILMPAPYGFVVVASAAIVVLLGTFLVSPFTNWASDAGLDLFRVIG